MTLSNLHYWKENEKMSYKTAFLVYENGPESYSSGGKEGAKDQAESKENNNPILNKPEFLDKQNPKFETAVKQVIEYNSLKNRGGRHLYIDYLEGQYGEVINLKGTILNIDELLEKPRVVVSQKDKEYLSRIKASFEEILAEQNKLYPQGEMGVEAAKDPQAVMAAGELLVRMSDKTEKKAESLNAWNKKEIYRNIGNTYDQLVESGKFDNLIKDSNKAFDQNKAERNKALFMAMAERATDGFNDFKEASKTSVDQAVENMMLRFQAAARFVDQRNSRGSLEGNYHPSVRNLLIVNYNDVLSKAPLKVGERVHPPIDNDWTFEQIDQSNYLNQKAKGKYLNEGQRLALGLAFRGGEVSWEMKQDNQNIAKIEQLLSGDVTPQMIQARATELGIEYNPKKSPKDLLRERKSELEAANQERTEFLALAQSLIQNPYDPEKGPPYLHPQLIELKQKGDGALATDVEDVSTIKADQLKGMGEAYAKIESNVNLTERLTAEESLMDPLKEMGLDLSFAYPLYSNEIQSNPAANVENWGNLNPQQMADVLERILPDNQLAGGQQGKEALLTVIRSFDNPITDPAQRHHREVVKKRVDEIKRFIEKQDELMRQRKDALNIIESELKDNTMGLNDGVRSFWELIKDQWRSPDLLDKFSAGVAFFGGAYLLFKAISGEDKIATGARIGILGLVANNLVEAYTGRDYTKDLFRKGKELTVSGIKEKAKNTMEGALADDGEKEMSEKGISYQEHMRALFALNDVPYAKAMKWYKATDKADPDYSAQKEEELYREMGIKDSDIVHGAKNKERTHDIVKQTFAHSIDFIAEKYNKPTRKAQKMMEEIWIEPLEHKDFPSHEAAVTFPHLYEMFHGKEDQLTFEKVMMAQVDPYLIEKSAQKSSYGPALAGAGKGLDWTMNAVGLGPENKEKIVPPST